MNNLNTIQKLFCPKCGHEFLHAYTPGAAVGPAAGAGVATAATVAAGPGIGLAMLGTAISGALVVPIVAGLLVAGWAGWLGKKKSDPQCPECSTKFSV